MKDRKERLLARNPSALDRFWLAVGNPVSGQELDRLVREHENALVRLGFLHQERLPAEMLKDCPQTLETLDALKYECPWYGETLAGTNFVVTACSKMMYRWRQSRPPINTSAE